MTTIYWTIETAGEEKPTKITWEGDQPYSPDFIDFITKQFPKATKIKMATFVSDQTVWMKTKEKEKE